MFKNQLQELAQRSCFNLPAYSCIREGPDHAPRFKATVNFNGEIFESPNYFSTLRQAEHAAAEVALNTLSRRGPSQSLAARILDETGVYKNLLQETAQRAGVPLPIYTTVRSGPGHMPVFTCTVEVGGMDFTGDAAKTKKQAEKNAAMTAWSSLKQYAKQTGTSAIPIECDVSEEQEQAFVVRALARAHGKDERSIQSSAPRTRQYHPGNWLIDANSDPQSHRHSYHNYGGGHYRSAPRRNLLSGSSGSRNMPRVMPVQLRPRRQEISVPHEEHQRDEEDWLRSSTNIPSSSKTIPSSIPSSSKNIPGVIPPNDSGSVEGESFSRGVWSNNASTWWDYSNMPASTYNLPSCSTFGGYGMAQPVRIRSVVAVSAAPPPRRPEVLSESENENKGEAATRQVLSKLSL